MSTENAKYTFLPWVKTGLGASILNNEQELKEPRAKIQVDLSVKRYDEQNIPSVEPISKSFFLYGPGDIKGILNSVIIRIEPNANILNFEPNYFPFIEFSQSDFPWRYTPAKPGGDQPSGRLSPWLVLIVLEGNEFDDSPPTSESGVLPMIRITHPERSLPDLKQCWGWAHTQIMQEITEPDSLRKILDSEPYKVISRILCLRKLKPDTHYFAFVVPTFELGRRAGLGIVDDNNVAGTSFAWSVDGSLQNHPLPTYYRWEFSTSPSGDFESLARKLENQPLPREVGIKKLDVSKALLSVGSNIGFKKPLFFGGALWSEEAKKFVTGKKIDLDEYRIVNRDEEDPSDKEIKEFVMEMKEQVDLGERLTWSFAKNAIFSNECKDPVISPPMYGKWHARKRLVSRISDDFSDPSWIESLGLGPHDLDSRLGEFKNDPPYEWLEQLNLDPTNRVAAGLGTTVVSKLQEELMESAWDQAGQILESNKRLRLSELSREVSSNIYHRCFQPLEQNVLIAMVSKFHSRVYLKFNDDNGDDKLVSVKKLLKDSHIPDAIFSPTFTKINTRYAKIQRKKFGLKYNNSFNILDRLNKRGSSEMGGGNAALDASRPGGLLTLDYLVHIPIHDVLDIPDLPDLPIKESSFQGDKLTEYQNNGQDPTEIKEMVISIENSIPEADADPTVEGLKGVEVEVNLDAINKHLKHSLNPQITIETKISKEVERPKRLLEETKDKLDTVIAYPEFKRPMFEPLREISDELLLPGMKYISPNTIGIVQTNPTFINSYMVGLNHEMARELLWREYPTDQRGSYFRQFWDASAAVERERASGKDEEVIIEKYRDIPEIHRWKHSLIENIKGIAESENGVLLIRGELLMRYPGTVIYAIKADSGLASNNNKPVLPDTDKDIKEPVFRGTVPPDITFLGFDIKLGDLLKSDEAPHGYFFIIQQQPSESRFGIDERDPKDPLVDTTSLESWNDLNWDHVVSSVGSNNYLDLEAVPLNGLEIENITWGTHAADLAYILLQHPVRIAVHARDLLPNLNPH